MKHYTPRPDMAQLPDAHNCEMLARANTAHAVRAARRRTISALIVVSLLFGMALAALAYSNAYARGIDAENNPHMEGFK